MTRSPLDSAASSTKQISNRYNSNVCITKNKSTLVCKQPKISTMDMLDLTCCDEVCFSILISYHIISS